MNYHTTLWNSLGSSLRWWTTTRPCGTHLALRCVDELPHDPVELTAAHRAWPIVSKSQERLMCPAMTVSLLRHNGNYGGCDQAKQSPKDWEVWLRGGGGGRGGGGLRRQTVTCCDKICALLKAVLFCKALKHCHSAPWQFGSCEDCCANTNLFTYLLIYLLTYVLPY